MREILFRGQRTDNKEWVYGYYTVFIEGIRKNHCIISENKDAKGLLDSKQIKYYVIPETVGQFIGLEDNNKVKIFEGDKVNWEGSNQEDAIIRFEDCCFNISQDVINEFGLEVVGNIFEKVKVE